MTQAFYSKGKSGPLVVGIHNRGISAAFYYLKICQTNSAMQRPFSISLQTIHPRSSAFIGGGI